MCTAYVNLYGEQFLSDHHNLSLAQYHIKSHHLFTQPLLFFQLGKRTILLEVCVGNVLSKVTTKLTTMLYMEKQ